MGEAARERFLQCGGGRLITIFLLGQRLQGLSLDADMISLRAVYTRHALHHLCTLRTAAHLLLSAALVHLDSTGQPPNEQAALQSRLAAGRPCPRVVRRHVWPGIAKRTAERASPVAQNLAPARFQVL